MGIESFGFGYNGPRIGSVGKGALSAPPIRIALWHVTVLSELLTVVLEYLTCLL